MYYNYNDFPTPAELKKTVYAIYLKKGIVCINGFKYFKWKDLNNIELNTRLSYPHKLFVAIHKHNAKNKNIELK